MQGANQLFLHGQHVEELGIIKGISFSPREIDILSCLMHMRGPSKISSLLSISPYTVVSHIRNIMLKIGCNSREGILDFIEQSQVLPLIHDHYAHLSLHAAFEKSLKDIAQIKRKPKQVLLLVYGDKQPDKTVFAQLENHLKQAGIDAIIERIRANENITTESLKNERSTLLLFWEEQEKIPKELCLFNSLNLSEYKTYYFLVFEILKKIVHPININDYIHNFRDQYTNMTDVLMNKIPQFHNIMARKGTLYKKIQVLKHKKWFLVFTVSCFLCTCYTFYIFKGSQQMLIK